MFARIYIYKYIYIFIFNPLARKAVVSGFSISNRLPRAGISFSLRASSSVEKPDAKSILDEVKDFLGDKCEPEGATIKLLCKLYDAQLALAKQDTALAKQDTALAKKDIVVANRDMKLLKVLLDKIQSRSHLSGGRALLEYAEQFVMKNMKVQGSRVDKWTTFFKDDAVGQSILSCVKTKVPSWENSKLVTPEQLATKLRYMYWEASDPHHADSYVINATSTITLPAKNDLRDPQMVQFILCIAEGLSLKIHYSQEWLDDACYSGGGDGYE
jgi:hypothetical protein